MQVGKDDPLGQAARLRSMSQGNFRVFDLANSVELDDDEISHDSRHYIRWSDDKGVEHKDYAKIYDPESVSIHSAMFPGPEDPRFCLVDASVALDRKPKVDINCLWSVGVLLRKQGKCGVEKWDIALQNLKNDLRSSCHTNCNINRNGLVARSQTM